MTILTRHTILKAAVAAPLAAATATQVSAGGVTHEVAIEGFKFVPADITIAPGDSVRFTNNDSAPHTATADDGTFDTKRLNRGKSATLTFASAGTFSYFCEFHPMMKGAITIA
ncbi:MAG: cupredoxin domain-containing protein [Planktomarina sp.]